MSTLTRIAILVCISTFLANLYVVSASDYQFAYMDESGMHYLQSSADYFRNHSHHGTSLSQGHSCRPHHRRPRPPGLVDQLLEHHAQEFCSTFLHIVPSATTTTATQTSTTSETLVTETATSTVTSNPGTTTVPATVTQSSTTTETDTSTVTETDTSTSTSISSTTTTTYLFTAPVGSITKRENNIPHWLRPFPVSKISSACSRIVTPTTQTQTVSATTTTTVPLTASATTTTTTVLPEVTDTTTTTATTTETDFTTETDTTTTVTTTTTSTTATATSTQCAVAYNVDGGGVDTSGTLTPYTNLQSGESCCEFCWTTTGCDLWFFFPGFGCFIVADSSGPGPTTQCPAGMGPAVVIAASGFDGNLGGAGPCTSGLVD